MGTQHALTTEQLEFLILIRAIEEFGEENGNETDIKEILTQDNYMESEEAEKILNTLESYGYLSEEWEVTEEGKQYIALFENDLQRREAEPDIVINNNFSLINIDKLNAGLNAFADFGGIGDFIKGMTNAIKKAMQARKKS